MLTGLWQPGWCSMCVKSTGDAGLMPPDAGPEFRLMITGFPSRCCHHHAAAAAAAAAAVLQSIRACGPDVCSGKCCWPAVRPASSDVGACHELNALDAQLAGRGEHRAGSSSHCCCHRCCCCCCCHSSHGGWQIYTCCMHAAASQMPPQYAVDMLLLLYV